MHARFRSGALKVSRYSTETEDFSGAMLEAENWEIAVALYKGHPVPALLLAHQLMAIRQCLERGRTGMVDALAGLDLAIESLYQHTDFHKISHQVISEETERYSQA